jgi:hypothetical protein
MNTRIIFLILTAFWMFIFLSLGISMYSDAPEQIAKDKAFVKEQIVPAVNFVEGFKTEYKRLPTQEEFIKWEKEYNNENAESIYTEYIRSKSEITGNDIHKFKNTDFSKDYAIGVWRGEWMKYYFSWNKKYDTNIYSLEDARESLIIDSVIALFPIIFCLLYYWRKSKAVAIN